jgi:hypothetical protein
MEACSGAIAEQSLIIFDSAKTVTIQCIASSSLMIIGKYLITKEVAEKLKDLLVSLAQNFWWKLEIGMPVIDCEFFFLKNGKVAVVYSESSKSAAVSTSRI